MKLHTYSFVLALPLLLTSHALAQQQSFKIDPQSSEVAFTLGDVLHTVHGVFHVESGAVDFDPAASKISGSVVVAAGSGNSGNETRDKRMSKDILDVHSAWDAARPDRPSAGSHRRNKLHGAGPLLRSVRQMGPQRPKCVRSQGRQGSGHRSHSQGSRIAAELRNVAQIAAKKSAALEIEG